MDNLDHLALTNNRSSRSTSSRSSNTSSRSRRSSRSDLLVHQKARHTRSFPDKDHILKQNGTSRTCLSRRMVAKAPVNTPGRQDQGGWPTKQAPALPG